MSEFVKVGKLDDFPEGRGKAVRLEGSRVAIFKVGGRLLALQDACPHMGASLADGRLVGGRVACYMHGWTFDLATGKGSFETKAWLCARTYEVRVEGQDVYLRRPPEAPPEPEPEDDWVVWDDEKFLKPPNPQD